MYIWTFLRNMLKFISQNILHITQRLNQVFYGLWRGIYVLVHNAKRNWLKRKTNVFPYTI